MTDSSPRDDAKALVPATPPAGVPEISPDRELDAHGFDPADFDWKPVRRQRRPDGWSDALQRKFIEWLADSGSVTAAAREVNMSVNSCYRLRRAPGAENFAAAWDAAIHYASQRLVDIAFDRALNGAEEAVFDKNGSRIATQYRYNDRLLMFLLRAHQPDRYRRAHENVRQPNEPPPPRPAPVAQALAMLDPVTPADPHLLMPPEKLADELYTLETYALFDKLYPADPTKPPYDRSLDDPALDPAPLGEEFERQLAQAKTGVWPAPEPKPKPRSRNPRR